jgi:Domain of unknown function (DUF4158)
MCRQQLTEAQIAALFDPPTNRRELVRYYTLSEADSAMIRRCRGDHSRLGYALMLCYLRYPGRPLRINERPPPALISFVAEQIDVRPEAIDDYLISGQNRRRHAQNCRTGSACAPSAGALPASWPARCCRMRLRVIGWLFWPSSLSRNAGSAGSSSHHPDPSNGYASTCVIRHGERLNVG